jgi:glycosyltransferase involved in cell wall biosynthesis
MVPSGAPQVSVVIPAFNAQDTIADTLGSALAQTVPEIEVLVVDDGSSDATAQIAGGTGDERVRVISTANAGVARARNRGIAEARGAFIAFLDADDLWRVNKLERQLAMLREQPETGVCFTGALRVNGDGRIIEPIPARNYDDVCAALLLKANIVSGGSSSALVRAAAAREVGGFDPEFSQCADWEYWLRLSLATKFAAVPESLVLYRTHPGNMSSDIPLLERDTFGVLDKFFSRPEAARYSGIRSRVYSNHWMICSGSYLHAGQLGASLRCLAHGLRAHPSSIRRPLGLPRRWWERRVARAT